MLTILVKYVALLAFNKIVVTHPYLVSQQEDVILECIDSPDITIRIQALDLVQGMVTGDNLMSIVSRLMKQLKSSMPTRDRDRNSGHSQDDPSSELSDGEASDPEPATSKEAPLPEDYRNDVVSRILSMCAKDNYSSIVDFDWYIDVLIQLVRMAPVSRNVDIDQQTTSKQSTDVAERIGDELRNVAVKVRAMRATAVRAAEIILNQLNTDTPTGHFITSGALKSVTWMMGEYAIQLSIPDDGLNALLQLLPRTANPEVITTALQAISKVFATIVGDDTEPWSSERKSRVSLLMARIIHTFEPLTLNPNLEVQERSVEFIELLRLTAQAASDQPASTDEIQQDPPLLLTQAIPSLFNGWELNSVAKGAQTNVPMPTDLDLDEPIHPRLNYLLSEADSITLAADDSDEFEVYYHQRPPPTSIDSPAPAISRLAEPAGPAEEFVGSYQQASEDSYLDADIVARRKAERQERNRDDPFYIPSSGTPGTSTPIHNILHNSNGTDLDIDSIPIMKLDLNNVRANTPPARPQPKPRQKLVISADETLEGTESGNIRAYDSENNSDSFTKSKARKLKSGLLQVDSSHIGTFSLEGQPSTGFDYERQQREEVEMQQAMKEVERLRLEMQRANERIHVAQGVDVEGTVVKKKKKKVKKADDGTEIKPKKKKKPRAVALDETPDDSSARGTETPAEGSGDVVVPKKKKKKPRVVEIQD